MVSFTLLGVVYKIQRIFYFIINNSFNYPLDNISFDTGEDLKSSQFNVTLQSYDDIFVYIYHNYSIEGSFTAIVTARTEEFIEVASINISI